MVNTNELKAIMVRNGKTQKDIAKLLGLSTKTFYEKMKKGDFGTDEAKRMIDILSIEDPIAVFFANKVT